MALINATLVAQAIHFYLGFLLIKHLFFKPIFSVIQQENSLQESLIARVQQQQMRVVQKEQELKDHWQGLKAYFARVSPSWGHTTVYTRPHPTIHVPEMPDALVKKEIAHVAQSIISQVEHGG